jgi:hypothetical protein
MIPEATKHQIILPKDNHISTLIIRHAHQKLKHQGRNHVLAELRQRYWIIRAGVAIKSLVHMCGLQEDQSYSKHTEDGRSTS